MTFLECSIKNTCEEDVTQLEGNLALMIVFYYCVMNHP
jgi:hypothetical protein